MRLFTKLFCLWTVPVVVGTVKTPTVAEVATVYELFGVLWLMLGAKSSNARIVCLLVCVYLIVFKSFKC